MSVTEPESYYPSCVVNLTLVFESKLQINVEDSGPVPFPETQQLVTPETASTYILNRVPKKCSVNLQGHTQAATYKLVFDYKELPIDPRTVVACSAEIHLGTVSATDFSEGMQRTLPNGQRRSILRTRTDDNRTIEDNLLMIGPADNWTVEYGTDGAEVHIEGRDLRGVLLDSPLTSSMDVYDELHRTPNGMPSRRRRRSTILSRLNTSQRIDRLVQQILQEHDVIRRLPENERVRVVTYEDEWPDRKVLSPMDGANLPRGRRGANGQGANAGGTQNNLNFWDVITRFCYLVGAVPRFVGRNLEIRYAPSIFQLTNPKNQETPFRPNKKRGLGDDEWNIRRLVYGRDIQSMKISRKYAGVNKPHAIRCVSIDNTSGRRGRQQLLQVVWPPRNVREARAEGVTGNRTAARDAVGGQESQEIRTYRVPAVRSLRQLTQIAQAFYEQIGRQEMTGEVEAARVTSFGGSNADPDMLRLRVGDPIELLVDASRMDVQSPIVSTINASSQMAFSEAVALVSKHLNGNTALARVIVASNRGNIMGVLRYFMVSNVNYDWSFEEVTVKADLQNYIIYRWGEIEKEALNNARQTTAVAQHQRHNARRALNSSRAAPSDAASNPVDSVSAPAASRMSAASDPIEPVSSPVTAADMAPGRTHGSGGTPSRWR